MLGFLSNLRDVKSALSAGMLMLFAGWLLLGDDLARVRPGDGTLVGRIATLVDYIGPVATLAVLPFVAYLIGLLVPVHFIGQWVIARRNRRNERKEIDSRKTTLQVFILDRVKRAGAEMPLDEVLKRLVREVPGFASIQSLYPDWMDLIPRRLRARVKKSWGHKQTVRALEALPGAEEVEANKAPTQSDFADWQDLSKQESMLTDILFHRIRQQRSLLAAALAQKDTAAYERFDKAYSESEFRAGLCFPLLIVTAVIAAEMPGLYVTWLEAPVLALLWLAAGAAGTCSIVWFSAGLHEVARRTAVFVVPWGAVGGWGVFGIPLAPVGVLVGGCVSVMVLAAWATYKGAEAQSELNNAIVLGHIEVVELQVLGAKEARIPNLRARLWSALRANG